MWTLIEQLTPYAIAYTMPLLLTALGGLYSERSGVSNVALEGLMIIGSFAGALTLHLLPLDAQSIGLALIVAAVASGIFSLLHAFACINLGANQMISGVAINMVAGALTLFIARSFTGSGNILIEGLVRTDIPWLSNIPILGKLLFANSYATTWLVLLICLFSYFIIYKTVFGLRLRACGEQPYAADAAGINVAKVRYMAVFISGMFSGLGGAIILVTYSGEFNGTVFGQGFLALVALIFGRWSVVGICWASCFFGVAITLANVSQVMPALASIPPVLLKIFPYVITILTLMIFAKKSQAPKALGEAFWRGKR